METMQFQQDDGGLRAAVDNMIDLMLIQELSHIPDGGGEQISDVPPEELLADTTRHYLSGIDKKEL